jgi:superfamily I DNA/RNA helicase
LPKQIVVVGPPGTGKTSTMTAFTEDWFKHGVDSREIAYLAFTKAAANEAANRIIGGGEEGFDDDVAKRFPYFRTIHSLAYGGLRKEFPDTRLMTTADMKRFGQWSSMDGTFLCDKWEDLASVYQRLQGGGKTEWDDCIRAYTISRMSCRSLDDVEKSKIAMSRKAAKSIGQVDASAYLAFVKKYEAYKNDNGLIDFTDMLVHALTQMRPIEGVKHVVIDEAQDLSPICVALCDRLFQNAETCFWAGDEDQAVYLFSGADARLFIDRYRKADSKILLRQTHRFGQEIWDLANKVIRQVSERIPKTVFGREGMKHHLSVSGEFEPFVGDALILHRHVAGCQGLSVAYRNAGMPFRNERGDDPLGYGKRVENFRTLNDLADGKLVTGVAATEFVTEFVPSMMPDRSVRLVTRGAMKKLNAEAIGGEVNLYDLQNSKILTSEGAEAVRMRYYNVFDHSEDFEYYHRVLENGYKLVGSNIPVITTMHGSKGRQAKKVVVFSEMSKRCWEDEDSEHRLAFVAMTRTEGALQVCAEQTVDWAKMNYDYPIKKESHG